MSIFSLKNHLFILIILRILWKKKRPNRLVESFWCVSAALSSRTASRRVFSAPHSLTSVFGMGTGGPYALWALTYFRCLLSFGSCLSLRQTSYFAVFPFSSAFRLPRKKLCFPPAYQRECRISLSLCNHYARLGADTVCWCTFRDSNPGPTD